MSLLLVALALACPALEDALARAEAALPADRAALEAATADAAASLACAAAGPTELGRYWAVEARRLDLAGDPDRAALAAQAALRLLPPEAPARAGLPVPAEDDGAGWLLVDANRASTRVDAAVPAAWPAEIPSGLHLVQVSAPDGSAVWYGRVVRVAAGEEVLIETGLPEADPAVFALPAVDAPPPSGPGRKVAWLVAGGVGAAGAGSLYALAAREHGRYLDADTRPEVEATWDRQRAFAGGAIALSALSAATVGLYFVF